jgi:hypothetical protein
VQSLAQSKMTVKLVLFPCHQNVAVSPTGGPLRLTKHLAGKADVSAKSFILTLGIFCGGYPSNRMLDEVVGAAERYFHVKTSAYKTDSNGYIIYSPEKPKRANNFSSLTRSASRE